MQLRRLQIENILLLVAILFSILAGFIGGVPSAFVLSGFVIIIIVWLFCDRNFKSEGLIETRWFRNILIGASVGILTALIASIIYLRFPDTSEHFFQLPKILSEKTGIESPGIIRIVFPISYLIGSFIHELFYRGLLQSRLSARIKPVYSVLIAAILFGWGHFPEGIYSVGIGFYEGIICSILFHKTGSIIAPWSFRVFHIGVILVVLGAL